MSKANVLEKDQVEDEAATTAADADALENKKRARGDYVEDPNADPDPDALAAVAGEGDGDEGEGADKKHEKAVPYERFNELNTKFQTERDGRLRAEGEAKALREGKGSDKAAVAEVVDIRALRKQAKQAMLDGDIDKAEELDTKADEALLARGTEAALVTLRAEEGQRELNAAVKVVVKAYPFLDSTNAAEKDDDAIADVVALRDSLVRSKGMSLGEALQVASERIGKIVLRERKLAAAGDGDGDGEGEDDPKRKKDPGTERQEQAIARGAAAANRQPATPTGGKGDRAAQASLPDVSKMSDAEFSKLTPAEKARLRGDSV